MSHLPYSSVDFYKKGLYLEAEHFKTHFPSIRIMKYVPANLEAFEVHVWVVVEDSLQWHPISRPAHLILTKPELRMKQICGFVVEWFRHIYLLLVHSRLNPGRQVFTRTPKKVFFYSSVPIYMDFALTG